MKETALARAIVLANRMDALERRDAPTDEVVDLETELDAIQLTDSDEDKLDAHVMRLRESWTPEENYRYLVRALSALPRRGRDGAVELTPRRNLDTARRRLEARRDAAYRKMKAGK